MTSETDLVTRLEQAGPESQAELLRESFVHLLGPWKTETRPGVWKRHPLCFSFEAMLNCGAYLSAAEMLVPQPGGHWSYNSLSGRTTVTFFPANGDEDTIETRGRATTPSLALAAACVRAAIAGKES